MSLQTPNPDMVTSYLREIASTFKVQVDEAALAPPADKQDAQACETISYAELMIG
jgi:hypothetical protein